jgi:serine/threonine protein kinase
MTTGTTIGNFQLLRTLGEGGMGVVFEAEHVTMHRRAAIKVLRPELIKDAQTIRRFFNEARATNEIRHPGIVQIYDCGTREDGSPWLIMELLEGETLSKRIARTAPMPATEVIALGTQTASVLEAAHRAGIIHRDLKPDNLFIVNNQETPSGERIKVLDFGIAKLGSSAATKSMHTQTGMLMGTPLYMSPEQCRGTGQVDARSDIYSFGLILYQMATGDLPFVSEGMGELFDMQMNRPPPPLERKVPGIAPALAEAILRTLRKDPAERFQSMAELQRALAAVITANPNAQASTAETIAAPVATSHARISPAHALPSSNTTLSSGAMEVEPFDELPRSRLARPSLIAGALLLVGGGVFAARALSGSGRAPPAQAEESARAASQGPAPRPAPSAPDRNAAPVVARSPAVATPPPAPRMTLDLKTTPVEATVIDAADGRLIGVTPLHQVLGRSESALQVRIEKAGYLSKSLSISRRQDYRGSIKLERAGEREPHAPREPREPREPATTGGEHIIKL